MMNKLVVPNILLNSKLREDVDMVIQVANSKSFLTPFTIGSGFEDQMTVAIISSALSEITKYTPVMTLISTFQGCTMTWNYATAIATRNISVC